MEQLRILAYTCAGGNEAMGMADGTAAFLPVATRQRLLERGLSYSPDVVIANGDHIYWDQATGQIENIWDVEKQGERHDQVDYSYANPALEMSDNDINVQ